MSTTREEQEHPGGTTSAASLRAAVHASPEHVDAAVTRVRDLALLWGEDDSLRALSGLTDLVGTRLSRLGAPAATLLAGYGPARVNALVHDLGLTPTGDRHDDVAAVAAALFRYPAITIGPRSQISPSASTPRSAPVSGSTIRASALATSVPTDPGRSSPNRQAWEAGLSSVMP